MKRRPLLRLRRRLKEPFPAVGGNSISAYENGPSFFARMLAAIDDAEVGVDVEQYLWDDDEVGRGFVDALRRAAERGVRVRVLIDASGASRASTPLRAVDAAGGDVRIYNAFRLPFVSRWFHRTHKKLLIVDDRRAFTGGAGFSQHWSSGGGREQPWHDRMFEVRGPAIAQLQCVFDADFARWERRTPAPPGATSGPAGPIVPPAPAGTAELRVLRGWPDAFDFKHALVSAVHAARERVWIGTPYFIPPPSLFHALRKAMKRRVDVQIVLPSGNYAHPLLWHASRRHYGYFIRRGAKILEYEPVFYHAKLVVVDRTTAIVGSSNLDYWSWDRNAEIDLVASDAATVDHASRLFEADRAASRPVTLRELGMRGAWERMSERFAGWIEGWL